MKTRLSKLTAAAIAFACLVPLCYGVGKLVTTFVIVDKVVVTFPDENNGGEIAYGGGSAVITDESLNDEEVAGEVEEEVAREFDKDVAKDVEDEVDKEVEERGHDLNGPDNATGREEMQQIFRELNELRQAGKFERTLVKEDEQNRITIRFYKDHFTLSSGKVITMDVQESWKDGKLIRAGGGWGGKEARTEKE